MALDPIERAVQALRAGRLVAIPTETVYGLAADAFQPKALARIFALKGRPLFDPLIVHVADEAQLLRVGTRLTQLERRLVEQFWPGPLTLIVPRRPDVPDLVTSGLDTVGVRMPNHPVTLALLRGVGTPLAAPSANRFGRISPTRAEDVRREFGRRCPLVLDGGPCRKGVESTIVRVTRGRLDVLRLGAITLEALEEAAHLRAEVVRRVPVDHPEAPGQLASHYAPSRPLEVLERGWRRQRGTIPPEAGLLTFARRAPGHPGPQEVLSPSGSLAAAARGLYGALRRLDESGAPRLYAERAPERGLGRTINDRLDRACGEKGCGGK